MSEETRGSGEFDDSTGHESAPDETSRKDVENEAADTFDEPEPKDEPSQSARVQSRIRRRTAPAPVRKKDIAASSEGDDSVIATLEKGFTDEDERAAQEQAKNRKPVKKTKATKKRSEALRDDADRYGPANPIEFTKQSVRELKQVVWPTWPELSAYFLAVLVFVVFFIAFIGLLDLAFGWSLLKLLGGA